MREYINEIRALDKSLRIEVLKKRMLDEKRFISMEQARLITESYRQHEDEPRPLQHAYALEKALNEITLKIDPDELIVDNRTPGVRGGVVSPEAGISRVSKEIETLPTRPQDRFNVRPEDIREFREDILPYWQGRSLEDYVKERIGAEISDMGKVVKINQMDHAQGHICPNTQKWLEKEPAGLLEEAEASRANATEDHLVF